VKRLTWIRVLAPDDLRDGECTSVEASGHALCLARVDGRYGAIDDACPHRGAPLGAGYVEDGRIVCPLHAWDFDVFTGSYRGGYPSGLSAYHTEVREDGIYVALRVVAVEHDEV
jgi:pyruvate oxidase